jgi:hypothetical protein
MTTIVFRRGIPGDAVRPDRLIADLRHIADGTRSSDAWPSDASIINAWRGAGRVHGHPHPAWTTVGYDRGPRTLALMFLSSAKLQPVHIVLGEHRVSIEAAGRTASGRCMASGKVGDCLHRRSEFRLTDGLPQIIFAALVVARVVSFREEATRTSPSKNSLDNESTRIQSLNRTTPDAYESFVSRALYCGCLNFIEKITNHSLSRLRIV